MNLGSRTFRLASMNLLASFLFVGFVQTLAAHTHSSTQSVKILTSVQAFAPFFALVQSEVVAADTETISNTITAIMQDLERIEIFFEKHTIYREDVGTPLADLHVDFMGLKSLIHSWCIDVEKIDASALVELRDIFATFGNNVGVFKGVKTLTGISHGRETLTKFSVTTAVDSLIDRTLNDLLDDTCFAFYYPSVRTPKKKTLFSSSSELSTYVLISGVIIASVGLYLIWKSGVGDNRTRRISSQRPLRDYPVVLERTFVSHTHHHSPVYISTGDTLVSQQRPMYDFMTPSYQPVSLLSSQRYRPQQTVVVLNTNPRPVKPVVVTHTISTPRPQYTRPCRQTSYFTPRQVSQFHQALPSRNTSGLS